MPLYCGHCGLKLRPTTRNEGTCICHTGNMMPYEPCGQIQVRKTDIQNVMVKAINVQAKILLDEAKNNKATSKELRMLQKTFAQLEAEKQSYRDERMNLYKDFKAGKIERDKFLARKTEVLKQEEECLAEYEIIQSKIEELQHKQEHVQSGAEAFREYTLLSEYDYDVVNHLISRVECFNDGHIKIAWNFKSEFKGAEPVEETVSDTPVVKGRVAVYTSDLWMMPQDSDYTISKRNAANYCVKKLDVLEENITFYHDDKADDGVYFREGYMKFIDEGRRGAVEALVIDSFKDLYLAHQDLENLIRFIIPKLPCRFIAVSDGFDSATADDRQYQEMYDSYKHVRQGDIMKYRTIERKAGKRVAATMRYPQCPMLYGYHTRENGSYADTEVIALIQQIYDKVLEIKKLSKVARWLNDQGIPTSQAFLNEEGYDRPERVKKWNAEKLWGVTKQEGYVSYCKYYDRCKELGKHCDRKPIIDKDKFDEVNEKYAYRKNR